MQKQIDQVGEFASKFGIVATEPNVPSFMVNDELQKFRLARLLSEVEEIVVASGYQVVIDEDGNLDVEKDAEVEANLEDILDGYVDALYILIGSIRLHGFHKGAAKFAPYDNISRFEHAFNRVHYKNMLKEPAQLEEQSKFGTLYDIVKPEGWEPAVLKDIIEP